MKTFTLISIPKERYDKMLESYSAAVLENEMLRSRLKEMERLVQSYERTACKH